MEVHKVKDLWLWVIKSMGETSPGMNRVEINLDLNQGEGIIFSVTSAGKGDILRWRLREGSSKSANIVENEDSKSSDGYMLSNSSSSNNLTDS